MVVTLTPSTTQSLDQAQTLPISANVANDAKAAGVTWNVTGGGAFSTQSTSSATYQAPASVTTAFTATVTATAISDNTKTSSLSIKVSPPPSITTTSIPSAVAGTAFSATLVVSGGTSPYTWTITSGTLPAGLSLNASTGAITGTPTGAASNTITFQVTDAAKVSASQIVTITITAPPALTITTTSPLAPGVIGTAYSQTLQATGGVPSYTWSVPPGTLPAGLSLSSAGVISGTPTGTATGTVSFTVTVTDSQTPTNKTATALLSIAISAPPLSVTTTSPLPAGSVGTAYSQTLHATGGAGAYTWSALPGTLPAGLSLSSVGVISGTPTGPVIGATAFTVTVTDSETPTQQTATANLSITISVTALSITTSSPLSTGVVNSVYPSTTLQAAGGITPYTWSVSPGTLPAGLSLSAAGVISGTPTASGTFNVPVTVKDSESPIASKTANLSITVNPVLSVTTTSPLPGGVIGTAYSQTLTAAGGIDAYTWSVPPGTLPAGLSLSSTGVLSGTPTGTVTGTTSFTVTVTDSESPAKMATASLSITISAPALSVTTTSPLPGGSVGTAYSQTLHATGGAGAYTWSVPPGTLPAGLTLSSAGVISGTPTGPFVGASAFTVTVTDGETPTAQMATAPLSITISVTALNVTASSLPTGVVNSVYPGATLQATGGITPYSWSVTTGSLPGGLLLNAATGAISGTPTASGPFNFTVTVTDSETPANKTATAQLSITVNPAVSVTTTSPLPAGVVGASYPGATLQAAGGISPYTWAVTTGSLPAGLLLNTNTGAITGTPTGPFVGTTPFTVTVTDNESPTKKTAAASLSIAISATTLTVTTTSLPTGVVGNTYNSNLQASGGVTPYTWGWVAAGGSNLPPGLSLSSSGAITGTPTATGTFNVVVTATDSANPTAQTANANLSISVNNSAPLTITTTGLPTGFVNSAYANAMLQANGGVQPYTWSISAGSLPANLSLNGATGAITGTPTATGTTTFTVKVTDNTQPTHLTQTAQLSITVSAALAITPITLPGGNVGASYNATVSATGGQQPYSWSVTSGPLPPGLSLSNNGTSVNITGSPTATGTYLFTLQVMDNESVPATATANLSISISSGLPLVITTTALPNGDNSWPYNAKVQATGGLQPYTWSIATGSNLPSGLLLSSSGGGSNENITGVPTAKGMTSFTIKVTDSESPAVTATANLSITIGSCENIASLKGHYAILLDGWKDATHASATLGSFVADGFGNITSGTVDTNDQVSGPSTVTINGGTYCVSTNNLALINLTTTTSVTTSYAATLDSTGNGHIIQYDPSSTVLSSGLMRKQTTADFLTNHITGNYAFGFVGTDPSGQRIGLAGEFTASAGSPGNNNLNGEADADDNGSAFNATLSSSNFAVVSGSTGRGTVQMNFTGHGTGPNFVFYVVNSSEMLFMDDDVVGSAPLITGQALQQVGSFSNASLNGNSIIELQAVDNSGGSNVSDVQVGLINANGSGSFSVTFDENDGGAFNQSTDRTVSGNYAIDSKGRMTLSNISGGGGGNHTPVFYFFGPNQAFVIDTGGSVSFGTITGQTGSSFTKTSLSGNYLGGSQPPVDFNASVEADQVNSDANVNLTGALDDVNSNCGTGNACPNSQSIGGTYVVSSSGRVVVSQNSVQVGILYIISSTQAVFMSTQDSEPTLTDFHQ